MSPVYEWHYFSVGSGRGKNWAGIDTAVTQAALPRAAPRTQTHTCPRDARGPTWPPAKPPRCPSSAEHARG